MNDLAEAQLEALRDVANHANVRIYEPGSGNTEEVRRAFRAYWSEGRRYVCLSVKRTSGGEYAVAPTVAGRPNFLGPAEQAWHVVSGEPGRQLVTPDFSRALGVMREFWKALPGD